MNFFYRKRKIKTPCSDEEMIGVVCQCSNEKDISHPEDGEKEPYNAHQKTAASSNGELPYPVIDCIRGYLPDEDRLHYFTLSSAFIGGRDEDGKFYNRVFNLLTLQKQFSIYLRIEEKYFKKPYLFYRSKAVAPGSNFSRLAMGIKSFLYDEAYVSDHFLIPKEDSSKDYFSSIKPSRRLLAANLAGVEKPTFRLSSANDIIAHVEPLIMKSRTFNRGRVLKYFPYRLFEASLSSKPLIVTIILSPLAWYCVMIMSATITALQLLYVLRSQAQMRSAESEPLMLCFIFSFVFLQLALEGIDLALRESYSQKLFGVALDKHRKQGKTSGDVEYDLSMCTLFFEHVKKLAETVVNEDYKNKSSSTLSH